MTIISYSTSWDKDSKLGRWEAKVDDKSYFGSKSDTTNSRCILQAIIQAIDALPVYQTKTEIRIANAGQYLQQGMHNIKAYASTPKAFRPTAPKTKVGADLANWDLWKDLIRVGRAHNIKLLVD